MNLLPGGNPGKDDGKGALDAPAADQVIHLGTDPQSKAPVGYITSVFDSGCQKYICDPTISNYLRGKTKSSMLVQTAISKRLSAAGYYGTIFLYFITLTLGAVGGLFHHGMDTVGGLTYNLMGYNHFRDQGFGLHLPGKTNDGGEYTEGYMYKGDLHLPLQYDPIIDFIIARCVISPCAETAKRWGRAVERLMQDATKGKAAAGTRKQVVFATTKINKLLSHVQQMKALPPGTLAAPVITRGSTRSTRAPPSLVPGSTTATEMNDLTNTAVPTADVEAPTENTHASTAPPLGPLPRAKPPAIDDNLLTANIQPLESLSQESNYLVQQNMPLIKGIKKTISSKVKAMSDLDAHSLFGHFGHHPWCKVCLRLRGSFKRVYRNPTPSTTHLPGYKFVLDLIVWSRMSYWGEWYTGVLRDVKSLLYVPGLHLCMKSDALTALVSSVKALRADPLFKRLPYPPCQVIKLDNAGEWGETNKEAKRIIESVLGCRTEYTVTGDHRSAADIDAAVKFYEMSAKAIQLQSNLEPSLVTRCGDQFCQMANRFPPASKSGPSGAGPRPIVEMSDGLYDDLMCNRFLSYTQPVGTVCFLYNHKALGSHIHQTKVRWGVVKRQRAMDGGLVFVNPHRSWNIEFTSKNYHALQLGDGMSYHQVTGCKAPPPHKGGIRVPSSSDQQLRYYVKLQDYKSINFKPVVIKGLKKVTSQGTNGPTVTIVDSTGRLLLTTGNGDIVPTSQYMRTDTAGIPAAQPEPAAAVHPAHPSEEPAASDTHSPTGVHDAITYSDKELLHNIQHDPDFFYKKTFYQNFPGFGRYLGTIMAYDPDNQLWLAHYPDGDESTLRPADMRRYFVQRADDPGEHDNVVTLATCSSGGVPFGDRGFVGHLIMHGGDRRVSDVETIDVRPHDGDDYFVCADSDSCRYAAQALGVSHTHVPIYFAWALQHCLNTAGGVDDVLPKDTILRAPRGVAWTDMTERADELYGLRGDSWAEDASLRQLNVTVDESLGMRKYCLSAFQQLIDSGKMDALKLPSGKVKDPKDWADIETRADQPLFLQSRHTEAAAIRDHGTFSYKHTRESLKAQGIDK